MERKIVEHVMKTQLQQDDSHHDEPPVTLAEEPTSHPSHHHHEPPATPAEEPTCSPPTDQEMGKQKLE